MLSNESNEIFGRISGEGRFMEVRITRNELLGRGVDIREVAPSAAGYPDLLARGFVALDNQNRAPSFSRLDSAHQTGRPGPDHDDVDL
jgi:hypothetical protein